MKLTVENENPGIRAMRKASQIAAERGISEMTLDEINSEIPEVKKRIFLNSCNHMIAIEVQMIYNTIIGGD